MSLERRPNQTLAEKLKLIDQIAAKINADIGHKVVGRIGADPEIMDKLEIRFIPSSSTDFNEATGGGYPRSRCTIISGVEDSGKTSRILEDIGYNMAMNPEFVALWIESEKSLKKEFVCDTFHIDPERFVFIEYDPEKGAEGILDMLYGFMVAVKFDIVCINSLKCMTPKKILDGDMDQQTPAVAARLNSLMSQKFTALVADSECAFILITHTYTGIGSYGSPQVISGGRAIRYWSALTMNFSKGSVGDKDIIKKDEGLHINVSIKKNHCVPDRNPYVKFDYYIVFGQGTEQYASKINALTDAGIISYNAGNFKFYDVNGDELKEPKIRGRSKFCDYMKEHPDFFQSLLERLGNKGSTIQSMSEEDIAEAEKEEAEDEEIVKAMQTKPVKVSRKKKDKSDDVKGEE